MTLEETIILRYEGYLRDGFMETQDNEGNIAKAPLTPDIEQNLKKQIRRMKERIEYKAIVGTMSQREALDWRLNQKINSPEAAEALSWFEQSKKHRIDGGSGFLDFNAIHGKKAIRLIKELYALGALNVVAIEINGLIEKAPYQGTDSLVVELPEESIGRQKVLEKIAKIVRRQRIYDPPADEGQKFVLLRWD